MREWNISRRRFFHGITGGTGLLLLSKPTLAGGSGRGSIPVLVSSHANETGKNAVQEAWNILKSGGMAVDAVERAANIVEADPDDRSVGYGGFPNAEGIVQLDASIMDGKTYNAGCVACLENIMHPSSVARVVMEKTDHVMLVGKGALKFARQWGFKETDLMTEKTREAWLKWKTGISPDDIWGPPAHLRNREEGEQSWRPAAALAPVHGTVNMLAVDSRGDVAGITTTSGWGGKIPGRVGDSPIIGAGLYVDNEAGAAGATGRGEDVIKSCASYYIVMRMKTGVHPEKACLEACEMITAKYRKINPNFMPGEKFIAVNTRGEFGCASMPSTSPPSMAVISGKGLKIHRGVPFPKKGR
jgi:N4-(beta-N-acetylglucosaminyl)-L-asparaginase